MKVFTFAPSTGHTITQYDSRGVTLAPILRSATLGYLACFYLEPHGVIGAHEAAQSQLLLILQGEARVTGREGTVTAVTPGDAVLWQQGEWHETRAGADGLTAVILEAEALNQPDVLHLRPKQLSDEN
jgi:quercetin dioxygenase-like cupin family protein